MAAASSDRERIYNLGNELAGVRSDLDNLTSSVANIDRKLDRLIDILPAHEARLQHLEAAELRRGKLYRWLAGIAAAIIAALAIRWGLR